MRPATLDMLVDVVGLVAAAAAPLPSYYYHYPKLYNVDFPIVPFLEAASTQIPTLAGVKYIDSNLKQLAAATALGRHKFEIISTHLLDGMQQFKTAGAIVYTPAVPLLIMLRDAVHDNNQTAIDYAQSRYSLLMKTFKNVGDTKQMVRASARLFWPQVDLGPPRLPLVGALATQVDDLQVALDKDGFLHRSQD